MPRRSKLTRAEIVEIFDRFARAEPEPKGELDSVNNYTLLVANALAPALDLALAPRRMQDA